jgi:hypothetical protein
MQPYIVVLTGFGIVVLLTAWLPMVLRELPFSLPIFCVGLGAAVFSISGIPGIAPHPEEDLAITESISELVVIVALMGAGLKLNRSLAARTAGLTWRLLGLAMPLSGIPQPLADGRIGAEEQAPGAPAPRGLDCRHCGLYLRCLPARVGRRMDVLSARERWQGSDWLIPLL